MKSYISRNLASKFDSSDYKLIINEVVTLENVEIIIKRIMDNNIEHLIIDINCFDNYQDIIDLVTKLKQNMNIQIIIIYYKKSTFKEFRELKVYDFINYERFIDLEGKINSLIKKPGLISVEDEINILKERYEKIVAFVSLEHISYTSTFIDDVMTLIEIPSLFVETKMVNTSYIEINKNIRSIILSNDFNYFDIKEDVDVLLIDGGKYNELEFELIENIADQIYLIDSKSEIGKKQQKNIEIKERLNAMGYLEMNICNKKKRYKYKKLIKKTKEQIIGKRNDKFKLFKCQKKNKTL